MCASKRRRQSMGHRVFASLVVMLVLCAVPKMVRAQCLCNTTVVWDGLMSLYDSTGGSTDWIDTTNWAQPGSTVCQWAGFFDCNSLVLSENNLRGTLPASLAALSSILTVFDVSNNSLIGTLPPEYSSWTSMVTFNVARNQLTGTLPPEYSTWTEAGKMYFGPNNLSGTLPPQYSAWEKAYQVRLMDNNLTGTMPPSYRAWSSVVALDVSFNGLSGTLPPEYGSWSMLERFDCSANNLSGTLPAEYSTWVRVYNVVLTRNQFAGTLPPQFSNWTSLRSVAFDSNRLVGSLPPAYSAWSLIQSFTLVSNELEGVLPPEYSTWTRISSFMVSFNRLTGTIPPQWSTWPDGLALLLDHNDLSGTLPREWTGKFLFFLGVHENARLSGTVPPLMSIPVYVALCNTSICGAIPQAWANTKWICQNITVLDYFSVLRGDLGFLRVLPAFLPLCPTPSPPTPIPSPTTAAPRNARQAVPAALTASSGLTTTALGANAISAVVVVATVGGAGGSTVGSFVQVSSLSARVSARLRDCGAPSSSSNNEVAVNDEVGSFVGDNPTTLALPGRLSSSGGTVLGNALLLFAPPPLAAGVYHAVRWAIAAAAGRGGRRFVDGTSTLLGVAVRLHLVVYAWVLAPTAAAAAVLLADGTHGGGGGGPAALGVFGLAAVVVVPVAGIAVAYVRSRPLKGKVFSAARSQRRRSFSFREFARRLCADRGSWALPPPGRATPRGRQKAGPGVVSQLLQCALSETLHGCVYPHGHVFLVDFALAAAQGLLAGLALSPEAASSCAAVRGLLWSIFAVSTCAAAFEACVRPRATLLDEGITLVMAVWTAVVSLLSALDIEDAASIAAATQAAVSLCCVVLQMVSGYVRRLSTIKGPRRSAHSEGSLTRRSGPHEFASQLSSVPAAPPRSSVRMRVLTERRPLQTIDALKLLLEEICEARGTQSRPSHL